VQGRGQWVGPDLSTIGVKYGRDELIRSILSPSTAIGYNFRSVVVALADGRVITGLPIEETADRLVLKTAVGERVAIPTGSIEERRTSDVSLMPDGLAQTLTDHELVDLIAYLSTLRQPVAIAGQFHVLGPIVESDPGTRIDPTGAVNLDATVDDGRGRNLSWRRVNANAEGLVDLAALAGADSKNAAYAYLYAPVVSPIAQKARLVIDTQTDAGAWVDGHPVMSSTPSAAVGVPRSAELDLPRGSSSLLIRVPLKGRSGTPATLVTTIVADQPVGFTAKP
jgi:putative heme-binding domain-containing protein